MLLHLEFSLDRGGYGRKVHYQSRRRRRDLGLDDTNLVRVWFRGLRARFAWAFGARP